MAICKFVYKQTQRSYTMHNYNNVRPEQVVSRLRPRVSHTALKLAEQYGYLPYMVERYLRFLGLEETLSLLKAVEKGVHKTIRCNTLVLKDCSLLPNLLRKHGIYIKKHSKLPHAYVVIKGADKLGHTTEHMLGLYYIQSASSMLAPLLLKPSPQDLVADLASAPGGKTTYLAQLMGNQGVIVSVDENPARIKALIANIQRMRVSNTIVIQSRIEELPQKYNGIFDKILLDAPCTAEGLLPVKKERKTSTTYEEIVAACKIQFDIVNRAVDLLKPSGYLLYVTCSIAPEENEVVLSSLLKHRDDIEIVETRWKDIGRPGIIDYNGYDLLPDMKKCLRVFPHTDGMEGFFYCLLKKRTT